VGSVAGLDAAEKRDISSSCKETNLDHEAHGFTDSAMPALDYNS
jgi:hypothetical protein